MTMHCDECGEKREVIEEFLDSAMGSDGRELEYRVYVLSCGHDASTKTGKVWYPNYPS